jgi:quercetin dioxygenase-like cupin family protein
MKEEGRDMFARYDEDGYITALPGIERKTLVYGEKTLMVEFRLAKGALLPFHSHPYEQTGYLVSGRMTLTVGDEARQLAPGDSWCIAADLSHGAEIHEDAVAIEVFSPLREDYLPPAAG